MKKIQRLTLDELESCFEILSEEECRNAIGGWCCFSYCLDYLGESGNYFNLYYGALYTSPEYAGGVYIPYIPSVLTGMGVSFVMNENAYIQNDLQSGDIIIVDNGSHATIFQGYSDAGNGYYIVRGYNHQSQSVREYMMPKNEVTTMIRLT